MYSIFKININPQRVYGLDILRALAILFVMLGHSKGFYPEAAQPTVAYLTFEGVSIFFVLSGYLIGHILIKNLLDQTENKKTLINFWMRRWLRTLPNYFLIFFVLLVVHILYKENFNPWNKGPYLIFSQNLFTHKHFFFTEAWSISIEEWFYLLIPLILYLMVRVFKLRVLPTLFWLSFLVIVTVTLFRLYRFYEIPIPDINQWDIHFRRQVSTRLDSIMFGVLAGALQIWYSSFWLKYKNLFFSVGVLILIVHQITQPFLTNNFGMYSCVFSFSVNSIGVMFILPFLSEIKTGKGKMFQFFSYISLISYSLYLVNYTLVNCCIIQKIPWDSIFENKIWIAFLQPASFWLISIFISVLLYKYFELPIMNLRDRIRKNRKELYSSKINTPRI